MKYVEGHGLPRAEAEAHAEAVNQSLLPQLATRGDLCELERRLTIRVGGMMVAVASFAIAITEVL
jgi:hypothetical protein